MEAVTQNIIETFENLKARSRMFITPDPRDRKAGEASYHEIEVFIYGYIGGLTAAFNNYDIHRNMNYWCHKQMKNTSSASAWTYILFIDNKDKSDEELKIMLLDLASGYFRANPNWYKDKY